LVEVASHFTEAQILALSTEFVDVSKGES
jgi:hypothetical protein